MKASMCVLWIIALAVTGLGCNVESRNVEPLEVGSSVNRKAEAGGSDVSKNVGVFYISVYESRLFPRVDSIAAQPHYAVLLFASGQRNPAQRVLWGKFVKVRQLGHFIEDGEADSLRNQPSWGIASVVDKKPHIDTAGMAQVLKSGIRTNPIHYAGSVGPFNIHRHPRSLDFLERYKLSVDNNATCYRHKSDNNSADQVNRVKSAIRVLLGIILFVVGAACACIAACGDSLARYIGGVIAGIAAWLTAAAIILSGPR